MLNKLNLSFRYRKGIFNDKNLELIAKTISILIEQSNLQTDAINKLLKEKKKEKIKVDPEKVILTQPGTGKFIKTDQEDETNKNN